MVKRVLIMSYLLLIPNMAFSKDFAIELNETIGLSDTIDLKGKTADGKEFIIKVDRKKFEKEGFKAIPQKICPPPVKKISENCVECANHDVFCK